MQRTGEAVQELPVVSYLRASLQLAYDRCLRCPILQLDDVFSRGLAGEPFHLAKGSTGGACEDGSCKSDSGEDSGEETHG